MTAAGCWPIWRARSRRHGDQRFPGHDQPGRTVRAGGLGATARRTLDEIAARRRRDRRPGLPWPAMRPDGARGRPTRPGTASCRGSASQTKMPPVSRSPGCCVPARRAETTADHLTVLDAAISALPPAYRRRLMITCDGVGVSHGLIERLDQLASRPGHQRINSVGWELGKRGRPRSPRSPRTPGRCLSVPWRRAGTPR